MQRMNLLEARLPRRAAVATAAFAAALSVGAGPAHAETVSKVALLTGSQMNPEVATDARGCARITIDTNANELDYYIAFSGLSSAETAAHIHGFAGPGSAGLAPVIHPLPAGNPKVGTFNYDEADEADILDGLSYIVIHSSNNPGGELRGQIVDMVADISGAQENPAVVTNGTGFGLFNVDRCANTLEYYIKSMNLSAAETAAHIHGFALHGTNAGVLHGLPAGAVKTGAWTYNEADELRILRGESYVNVHTSANPGGEVRGQIVSTVVPIDSDQAGFSEVGHGCGFIATNRDDRNLSYFITYQDLTGSATAAHFHGFAPPGQNAGVVHGIGTANPAKGVWNYTDAQEADILAGLTYINVHTAAHPGGEIRGQVIFPVEPCFADTDCDGTVNVFDLLDLLAAWGDCDPAPAPCAADITGDGTVNVFDLLDLLAAWGDCP